MTTLTVSARKGNAYIRSLAPSRCGIAGCPVTYATDAVYGEVNGTSIGLIGVSCTLHSPMLNPCQPEWIAKFAKEWARK